MSTHYTLSRWYDIQGDLFKLFLPKDQKVNLWRGHMAHLDDKAHGNLNFRQNNVQPAYNNTGLGGWVWVWKVFLQTRNSVGLTQARQGATWVAIPLPGASFQELFSLPGHPLAPGRFLPATIFQFESFITCCAMVQEEDCLLEVIFSDVILYEWR